jgi:hypothetical protein
MSISIYYTATRNVPLTPAERSAVDSLVVECSVDDQIAAGTGRNWESFCVYDSTDPTIPYAVFEGATKLPDDSEDAVCLGLQHWCKLLTAVRHAIPDSDWHVHVDDHVIPWDASAGEFDPSG